MGRKSKYKKMQEAVKQYKNAVDVKVNDVIYTKLKELGYRPKKDLSQKYLKRLSYRLKRKGVSLYVSVTPVKVNKYKIWVGILPIEEKDNASTENENKT